MKWCIHRDMIWIPTTPPIKHTIIIQDASFGEKPPASSDRFEDGNILYSAEKSWNYVSLHPTECLSAHTITPKLRLSDSERKMSLSWILKSLFPGNRRTMMSMQMKEAPNTHAVCALAVVHCSTTKKHTNTAQRGHDPSSSVVFERHGGERFSSLRVKLINSAIGLFCFSLVKPKGKRMSVWHAVLLTALATPESSSSLFHGQGIQECKFICHAPPHDATAAFRKLG